MSGASIAITLPELEIIIANDRGYSLDPKQWSQKQKYIINDVVVSGVAQVYCLSTVDGERVVPDWTFLKPIAELSLPSGSKLIKLPDDFGSLAGPLAVKSSATTTSPWRIRTSNEAAIMAMYSVTPTMTGPPAFASEVALRDMSPDSGQRRGLMIFPLPDQDYLLQAQYSIIPDRLSGAQPFAYGGPRYRELFIASCLATSEQRFDNVEGVMTKKFQQMLLGAVSEDNKNRADNLGYNGNEELPPWRGYTRPVPLAFYYNDQPIT